MHHTRKIAIVLQLLIAVICFTFSCSLMADAILEAVENGFELRHVCDPEPADCSKQVARSLSQIKERPLWIKVGEVPGQRYIFNEPVVLESGIRVSGVNAPVFVQRSNALFIVPPQKSVFNVKIDGFSVNQEKNITANNVMSAKPGSYIKSLQIEDIKVEDTDPSVRSNITFNFLEMQGEDFQINRVSAVGMSVFVNINRSRIRGIRLEENTVFSIAKRGVSLTCECEDVSIVRNSFKHNVPGIQPSNMIYTNIKFTHERDLMVHPVRDLKIIDNEFVGIRGIAFTRGVLNGASADLITLRNVHGFIVKGNRLQDSGEAGIMISDGSLDGRVVENSIIRTDTVPIVIGAAVKKYGGYAEVERIKVADNYLFDFAIFQQQLETKGSYADWGSRQLHARSGVRVVNARDICIVQNTIGNSDLHGRKYYGIWVLDRINPASNRNSRIYEGNNKFTGFDSDDIKVARASGYNKKPIAVQASHGVRIIETAYDLLDPSSVDDALMICEL